MNLPLVPQEGFGFQGGLLTALLIGFFFGFALERAGFGNAKKLAAQFYLYDMTVFKVMFSAILTAMTGLYAFQAFGLVNLDMVWINPTFFWPQLIAGFLLGAGFLVSGLCPGTGFVSMASGKTDAFFAIAGIFLGTLLFGLALDSIPILGSLYSLPGTRILLPELVGIPAPWLAMAIVLMALGCFIGAEKVEQIFTGKYSAEDDIERSFVPDKKGKFLLAGSLALVCLIAAVGAPKAPVLAELSKPSLARMEALNLAELLISREPGVTLLDLRGDLSKDDTRVPGSVSVSTSGDVPAYVSNADSSTRLVLIASRFQKVQLPDGWPHDRNYAWLDGGIQAWQEQVLTPATAINYSTDELDWVKRQNQIAAYYSGAKVESAAAPPPPASSGKKKKKKASGGC